jgi:hypothetical protein
MSEENNNSKMSEAEARKRWARAPQDHTNEQLDELKELDFIHTEEELAAMFVFDYDRFTAGVAAFYDHPALDHSFVIGAGYEFVRVFPEMARKFLGEFDAALSGGLVHEDGKREPTLSSRPIFSGYLCLGSLTIAEGVFWFFVYTAVANFVTVKA